MQSVKTNEIEFGKTVANKLADVKMRSRTYEIVPSEKYAERYYRNNICLIFRRVSSLFQLVAKNENVFNYYLSIRVFYRDSHLEYFSKMKIATAIRLFIQ